MQKLRIITAWTMVICCLALSLFPEKYKPSSARLMPEVEILLSGCLMVIIIMYEPESLVKYPPVNGMLDDNPFTGALNYGAFAIVAGAIIGASYVGQPCCAFAGRLNYTVSSVKLATVYDVYFVAPFTFQRRLLLKI